MITCQFTERELAILAACLRRCEGWDTPSELERFVSIFSETVSDGWTEGEMYSISEKLGGVWLESRR